MMVAKYSDTNRDCHSDDDPEVTEGEEEESVVVEAAKKQIPRAKSGRFGMTTCLAGWGHWIPQSPKRMEGF
jgi:hypothetical protein